MAQSKGGLRGGRGCAMKREFHSMSPSKGRESTSEREEIERLAVVGNDDGIGRGEHVATRLGAGVT